MTTTPPMPPTVPPLFDRLVDDAAVFPPGNMPLADAVPAHRRHRSAWYSSLVGPLLCPASQLPDLRRLADDGDEPLGVTVIVDTGTAGVLEAVDEVANDSQLTLRSVEIPIRGEPLADSARRIVAALDAAMGGSDDEEPAYLEVPRAPGWESALDVIAESGYRAKLRTGGADASAYPSSSEVAAFVLACLDRGVAVKLTAGLHRAVRHPGPDGATEHGFLNVLLGVARGLDGGDHDDIVAVLDLDDADQLVAQVRDLSPEHTTRLRRWFASYGSCSIDEPLTDLIDLGLVTPPQ